MWNRVGFWASLWSLVSSELGGRFYPCNPLWLECCWYLVLFYKSLWFRFFSMISVFVLDSFCSSREVHWFPPVLSSFFLFLSMKVCFYQTINNNKNNSPLKNKKSKRFSLSSQNCCRTKNTQNRTWKLFTNLLTIWIMGHSWRPARLSNILESMNNHHLPSNLWN